ncbi:MAG: hypothetical protein JO036_20225 [Candidatus Eremiobacteraeota bacterium]|nr:hypothetical protein [Candidatus Eremiobacteraeota bacterium]
MGITLLCALGDQRGMLYYHLLLGRRLAARGEGDSLAMPPPATGFGS